MDDMIHWMNVVFNDRASGKATQWLQMVEEDGKEFC
jgi:hypothetical protein